MDEQLEELDDSGDEDMEARRRAVAEQAAVVTAAETSVSAPGLDDDGVSVCMLCRNMRQDGCPRCDGTGIEPAWAALDQEEAYTTKGDPRRAPPRTSGAIWRPRKETEPSTREQWRRSSDDPAAPWVWSESTRPNETAADVGDTIRM